MSDMDNAVSQRVDEQLGKDLTAIKKKLLADRQKALRVMFVTAGRYKKLIDQIGPSEVKAFLADECRIPPQLISSYLRLNDVSVADRALFEKSYVSPDVVLTLTRVRADVRAEAIEMIRSGRNLQVSELAKIRRDIDFGNMTRATRSDPSYRNALKNAARRRANETVDAFLTELEKFSLDVSDIMYSAEIDLAEEATHSRLLTAADQAKDLLKRMAYTTSLSELRGLSKEVWTNVATMLGRFARMDVGEPLGDAQCEEQSIPNLAKITTPDRTLVDWIQAALGQTHVLDINGLRSEFNADGRISIVPGEHAPASEKLTVVELCAGAGGQAIGLHSAGFKHLALIEADPDACATMKLNRRHWPVIQSDVRDIDYSKYSNADLLAGGVPCQPFSASGKQRGKNDERDLFAAAIDIVEKVRPRAVMLENVGGVMFAKHLPYRLAIIARLKALGYDVEWRAIYGPDLKISQLRTRAILVAIEKQSMHRFRWPLALDVPPMTVGELIGNQMAANGWGHATAWAKGAQGYAPTLIGGSKNKNNTDMAQPKSRAPWLGLGIEPRRVVLNPPGPNVGPADRPGPDADPHTFPNISLRMAATLQGFPEHWRFAASIKSKRASEKFDCNGDMPAGSDLAIFRQIANAFPPYMAKAVGLAIRRALTGFGTDLNRALDSRLLPRLDLSSAKLSAEKIEKYGMLTDKHLSAA